MRAMKRLDGPYNLLALSADDYVAGFPKQMERVCRDNRRTGAHTAVEPAPERSAELALRLSAVGGGSSALIDAGLGNMPA